MNITLYGVTLDCPDAGKLAAFYGDLTGTEVTYSSPEMAALSGEGAVPINFQAVEGYQAPKWPSQEVGQQFHLDFGVDNLEAAEKRAIELGATRAEPQPNAEKWLVMLDPAGHPFCLSKMS